MARSEPVNGKDVRITIDIELQAELENAFTHAEIYDANHPKFQPEVALLHGAAIVIDVPTGEVRALTRGASCCYQTRPSMRAALALSTLGRTPAFSSSWSKSRSQRSGVSSG